MEAIYERQQDIELLNIQQASVIGCGGVGYWVALFLAMSGVEHLLLFDDDILEITNLNRLPLNRNDVGNNKTSVLRDRIRNLRQNCMVETYRRRLETEEDCSKIRGDVCFCCTDTFKSQKMINAYCRRNGILYQRAGYDGTLLNVSRATPLSFGDVEETGYEVTPSWVVPAVMSAATAVASVMHNEIQLMDDIDKLNCGNTFVSKKNRERIERRAIDMVVEDPYKWGLGHCGSCDRGVCDDCEKIASLEMRLADITDERDQLIEDKDELRSSLSELDAEVLDLKNEIGSLKARLSE